MQVRDSQQTAAREAFKTCGRHVVGSGAEAGKESTTRRQEACRCGGVSAREGGGVELRCLCEQFWFTASTQDKEKQKQ
jgi:hypothetical protein